MSDEDIKIAIERLVDNYPKDHLSFDSTHISVSFFAGTRNSVKKYSRNESTRIAQHIFKLLHTNGVYTAFPNTE